MSGETTLATAAVLLPAATGALLLAVPATRRLARPLGIVGALSALLMLAALAAAETRGVAVAWTWSPSLRVAWRLELAPLALALLVSGIGVLILQFAGVYFGATDKGRRAIGVLSLLVWRWRAKRR